jgi:transcriptional regulator with XRE-family HTH domain
MTPEEFKHLRLELGLSQRQLGGALGLRGENVGVSIRRIEDGKTAVSGPMALAMRHLAAKAAAARRANVLRPADEWIHGKGTESEREYLIHTRPPRFIARLILDDLSDDEHDAKTLSGVTYVSEYGDTIREIHWIDPPPASASEKALAELFSRAESVLEVMAADEEFRAVMGDGE